MKSQFATLLLAAGLGAEAQIFGSQPKQPAYPPQGPYGPPPQFGAPKGVSCGAGLPPCATDLYCKKVDNSCLDIRGTGNCIGTCSAKGFFGTTPGANGAPSVQAPPALPPPPKGYPPQGFPPQGYPPQQGGYPPPPQGGFPFGAPPPLAPSPPKQGGLGGLFGFGGSSAPPQPPPQQGGFGYGPPPPQPPPPPPPPKVSGSGLFGLSGQTVTPITIRQCPPQVRCQNRDDVCIPHPKIADQHLCVNADNECGWQGFLNLQNKGCPAGQSCLANPKYTCERSTGLCQGNDGICVSPPP